MAKKETKEELDIQKSITKELQEQAKLRKMLVQASSDISESDGEIVDHAAKYVETIEAANKAYERSIEHQSKIDELQNELNKHAHFHTDESKKLVVMQIKSLQFQKSQVLELNKALKTEAKLHDLTKDQIKQEQEKLRIAKEQQKFVEKYSDEIEKQLGFLDSIDDAIKEIPIVGGVLSKALGLDDIKKELSEKMLGAFTEGLQGAEGAAGGLMGGLQGAAGAARGVLLSMGPLLPIILAIGAAVMLIKAALDLDKEVTELAKNLDVSKNQAKEIHHTAIGIASEMNQVGINSEQVVKVMEEMKTSMGYNVGLMAHHNEAARKLVETTTLLVEKQGLSTQEAVDLNRAAIAVNLPMENVALMAAEMGDELVSGREIMQDLGKVSKGVLLNFSKNPAALVKAVKQANLLGTTLDKINSAGDNMLDIESSIQKEMEARVITGKNLNLNQARYYAMTGDTEKLQEEIAKQMGSAADYEKMSVIQRKALAEAMGMSKDEMDEMMVKQKELETLGYDQVKLQETLNLKGGDRAKALAAMGSDEAKQLLEKKYAEQDRVEQMQKLSDIGKKLMDQFTTLLEPVLSVIGPIFDIITGIADVFIGTLSPIIKELSDTFSEMFGSTTDMSQTFKTIGKIIGVAILVPMRGLLATINFIKENLKGVFEIFGGIKKLFSADTFFEGIKDIGKGIVRILFSPIRAIIDTAIGLINSVIDLIPGMSKMPTVAEFGEPKDAKEMHDGVIGPGGKMVVSSPAGAISLNPNDSIVAGTNLFGGGTQTNTATNQPAVNDPQIGEMISLLKQLVAATSGPTVIKIGSKTIEELDSQISLRKNYNIGPDRTYGNRL